MWLVPRVFLLFYFYADNDFASRFSLCRPGLEDWAYLRGASASWLTFPVGPAEQRSENNKRRRRRRRKRHLFSLADHCTRSSCRLCCIVPVLARTRLRRYTSSPPIILLLLSQSTSFAFYFSPNKMFTEKNGVPVHKKNKFGWRREVKLVTKRVE